MNMKLVFFATLLALASSELDLTTFDWSSVKPLSEIKEWRDAHPNYKEIRQAHPSRPGRILDGEIAGPTDYPYIAGVMLHYDTGNSWCGGSLISRNFVLTAANCVFIVPSASVLLGASNIHTVQENIRVQTIRVHPQYDFNQQINDIATLELSQTIDLSSSITLVRLPTRSQAGLSFENQQSIVAGWGRTTSTGTQPIPTQFLRVLRVPVMTNNACRIRYPAIINDSNICTNPTDGTPCEGDEGGPLMIQEGDGERTQIGVYSFQYALGCGLGWPAVYARVTSFLDFIEQNSDVTIL